VSSLGADRRTDPTGEVNAASAGDDPMSDPAAFGGTSRALRRFTMQRRMQYSVAMADTHEILQLARWIARQEGGAAQLRWGDGELILRVYNGRIRFVEGIDTAELCRRLSCEPIGHIDLLEEARELAASGHVAETHAMGAAKELLQQHLRGWLLDPQRELDIVEGEPDAVIGATISITHTLVEMVLSDTSGAIASAILPDFDVLLSRAPNFIELYSPLRLSEDADLIVSKITGERTAREVAERSEHPFEEVSRLLAAMVVTGIFEPEPELLVDSEVDLLPAEGLSESPRRRIPVSWIVGSAALLLIVLLAIAWIMSRSGGGAAAAGGQPTGRHWALVVDMGCEPQDLQRVLKKADQHPDSVRPVAADANGGQPCWQLVWGHFSNRDAALRATSQIPATLRREGFDPHPIELTGDEARPSAASGG
jgi:hypothetical protein